MKMNRSLIGWVVAAVLAVVLAGVLVYDATSDDGGREASLGGGAQGQAAPPEVAADIAQIKANKPNTSDNTIPAVPPGQTVRELKSNPPHTDCDPNNQPNAFAEWEQLPQNLNQAAAASDQIVVGTVTGVENGTPHTTAVTGEPGGEVSYATQNVTVRVDEAVKGPARAGGVVTIERLGDAEGCLRVAGDPPYRAGQQYLLMLENGERGHPAHPISPAGRYEIGLDKALQAMEDNPVAQDVARQKLEQVLTRLKSR